MGNGFKTVVVTIHLASNNYRCEYLINPDNLKAVVNALDTNKFSLSLKTSDGAGFIKYLRILDIGF